MAAQVFWRSRGHTVNNPSECLNRSCQSGWKISKASNRLRASGYMKCKSLQRLSPFVWRNWNCRLPTKRWRDGHHGAMVHRLSSPEKTLFRSTGFVRNGKSWEVREFSCEQSAKFITPPPRTVNSALLSSARKQPGFKHIHCFTNNHLIRKHSIHWVTCLGVAQLNSGEVPFFSYHFLHFQLLLSISH